MPKAKISIVIGTYNRKKMLINCIESIRCNGISVPHEIIVVDGGSNDGTHKWMTKQKDILTIIHHNRYLRNGQMIMEKSWGYFMNLGFKSTEGEYICMLSDDCYVHPGAIMKGFELLEKDAEVKIGACAFPFRNSFIDDDFMVYCAFGTKTLVNHGIYRRDILVEIGWIEENSFKFYLADTDLSLKIWDQDYTIVVSSDSWLEHLHHEFDPMRILNKGEAEQNRDYAHFENIWAPKFKTDVKQPTIEKVVLNLSVPNKLYTFLPKGLQFKILFFDRWLKNYIRRGSFIYTVLKRLKWSFFGKES